MAPRVLCTADNGASLDAAGLAHSTTEPCIGGDCTPSGSSMTNVGSGHRKIQSYATGSSTDGTSSGDLTNCDSAASGAGSHGNQVANILVGNPSNGINGLGITRDDNDQDTNNEFDERFLPLDGEARGARLIFQDISITTTGSGNPCNQLPSATGPGANFVDQGNVVPGSIAQRLLDCAGASVIVFPFGVPNFDNDRQLDIDTGHYAAGAVDIDAHMFENRKQVIMLPTGNDGADPFDGNDIYPDDPGHPSCDDPPAPGCPFDLVPTRIQVNNLATAKNAVTVGSSRADTIDFFGNFDETENYTNFTSKGPATFTSRRRAPMVMGQGSAGMFFAYLLKRAGAAKVIVSDLSQARLAVSPAMGADLALHPNGTDVLQAVLDETGGAGADYVIEAVGSRSSLLESVKLVREGGDLLLFGLPDSKEPVPFNFAAFFGRRISASSTYGAQSEPGLVSFRAAVELIRSGAIDVSPVVSHILPIEEIDRALHMAHERIDNAIKVSVSLEGGSGG
ncbi:MAG: zinc-binding dehydrogenase [SAR324 cluster bacterium]|nr:zinc-binding dehydrogenase [SAR324 cluster bacterium]